MTALRLSGCHPSTRDLNGVSHPHNSLNHQTPSAMRVLMHGGPNLSRNLSLA